MLETLLTRIKAADFTVLGDLRGLGPAEAVAVAELLTDPEPTVRELVLWVLDELGGLAAARAGAAAVLDENPQVVGLALRVLRHHATTEVLEQVFGDYTATTEPTVRGHLALILGRLGAAPADVLALEASEADPGVRDTLVLVAAHLGDADARARTATRWPACGAKDARRALEDLEFLNAAWVLADLRPFLGDATPVLRIGAERPPGPEYLRVCDLTVNLVARLGPSPFPFPTDGKTAYTDEQLQRARGYLDALARA
jgi:HEAT repeat protein